MSLFTTIPDFIHPVYSDNKVVIYDPSILSYSEPKYVLLIKPSIGVEKTFIQLPDLNNKLELTLETILQSYFDSTLYTGEAAITNIGATHLMSYQIDCSVMDGNTIKKEEALTKIFYTFNGIDRNNTFDASLYFFHYADINAKALNNWGYEYNVHRVGDVYDPVYIQMLSGEFYDTGTTCDASIKIDNITIEAYKPAGIYSTTVDIASLINQFSTIISFNIGANKLNKLITIYEPSIGPTFIDASTYKYTVTFISDGTFDSQVYTVNIEDRDERFDRYFRINYVDSMGCTNSYNFDKGNWNTVAIAKSNYLNADITKIYNTNVIDTYTVHTDWMSQETSYLLKDLWYSPNVSYIDYIGIDGSTSTYSYVDYDITEYPILLDTTSIEIKNRINGPINYQLNFSKANKYKVQRT